MDVRRLWKREDLRSARKHVRNRGMPEMQGDEIPNLLPMKTVTIEASIPVGARLTPEDILRVLRPSDRMLESRNVGSLARIQPKPLSSGNQDGGNVRAVCTF